MEMTTIPPPVPPPSRAPLFALQPPPPPVRRRARRRRLAKPTARTLYPAALALLLLTTLLLRLWGVGQGLPYSYNIDEAQHFVPRAISFFSQDLNPHYFLNPPAYSYLLGGVFEAWFGSGDAAVRAYVSDPTAVFVVARVVAAVLGTLAVLLTCLAGVRMLGRAAGLLAAAIFGFAFLPIFYSHLALNDVPTLAPVALSLYGTAGVYRSGRWRDYLLAGAGIGLAAATKYTGGVTLVCLLAATGGYAGGGAGLRRAGLRLAAALGVALAAFTLANPYWILDFHSFASGISAQASEAAGSEPVKLGTRPGGGVSYYLWTFTWGFGLAPAIAAVVGALTLAIRRRWVLLAILVPAPIAFILFMGDQQRYFGRWLMPIFPIVALLGAYAAVEAVRWLADHARIPAISSAAVLGTLLLTPSLVSVIHDDAVLSRPDTRNLARAWMVGHVPAGAKVVVEPIVPTAWASDVGRSLRWTPTGQRWYVYPTWLSNIGPNGRPLPAGQRRYVLIDEYERVLRPALVAEYMRRAYCWVVVGSLQAGRAYSQPRDAPGAIAYYRALHAHSVRVYHVSPFAAGAKPVPFGFDFSIDYYPGAYRLPGPVISIYHLRGGRCAAV